MRREEGPRLTMMRADEKRVMGSEGKESVACGDGARFDGKEWHMVNEGMNGTGKKRKWGEREEGEKSRSIK